MTWREIELKNDDKVAQAGVALVEQALLADAYPDTSSGSLKLNSGKVDIDSPKPESVKTKLQVDNEGTTIYIENIASITDKTGRTIQTIDQQQAGDFLATNVTNKIQMKTIVRGADGGLQYQLQGQSTFTPKDGSFKDDTFVVFDKTGAMLPIQVHLTARNVAGGINIVAETTLADATGKQIVDEEGKPTLLGKIEANLNYDPRNNAASYKMQRAGAPLYKGQ